MAPIESAPEIFRYAAFNGYERGLKGALLALEKLARLHVLATRGIRDDDCLVVGDALMQELSEAVF